MRRILPLTTLIISLVLTACHSNKSTTSEATLPAATVGASSSNSSKASSPNSSKNSSKDQSSSTSAPTSRAIEAREWKDVYMPVKVSLSKPMSMSLSGRATMIRGEVIHISMRMMGFEVAVMNINSQTATFIDKYHKYMFSESLDKLLGSHKMSVSDIQDLILKNTDQALDLTFNNSAGAVTVSYSNPTDTDFGTYASDITINGAVKSLTVKASLAWTLKSASWNSGRTVDFQPPTSGYKIITLENAKSIFENMAQ